MTSAIVTIAVDAGGSDHGPVEVVRAAGLAATAGGVRVEVYGAVAGLHAPDGVVLLDAPKSIAKAPDPARAVRAHPEASVVAAVRSVAEGRADAVVAGGSTGAVLAASLFSIKRGRGIYRPALAMPVPVPKPFLLLDVGANVEVRAEHLVQFAHMGAAYARYVLGLATPRVALLSNGEEATRGRDEVRAAHATLAEHATRFDHRSGGLDFVGNVEGFAIATGAADVVVCDGFTGNVALKVMEGAASALMGAVRTAAATTPRARLGGLLLRPALRQVRDALEPERQGGAVLLGLRRPVVVPHGSFRAPGIAAAIALATRAVRDDLVGQTHGALEAGGALRRGPAASAPGDSVSQ